MLFLSGLPKLGKQIFTSLKKTTLHIVAAIAVAATLVTGCEKSHVSRPSVKQQKAITIHCSPYRNVTGYVALCSELRAVTNCMGMDCSGSAVTTTLTNYVLINPAITSLFTFASNQVITPTEQNDVMLAAKAWANANTPSGYFVSYINY